MTDLRHGLSLFGFDGGAERLAALVDALEKEELCCLEEIKDVR